MNNEQEEKQQTAPNVLDMQSRRKKLPHPMLSSKLILLLLIVVLSMTCIVFSPLFAAENIVVTKMEKYTSAEIGEKIGLTKATNLFLFGKNKGQRILEKDPYIQSAKITKKYPNTITIDIEERRVRGYIPYMGSYLYIDEFGRVLDIQTSFKKVLPIVNGLQFDSFKAGEILQVSNKESFDIVVKIAQMMTKYELLDTILSLDVSDPMQITAYVNQVEIRLGSIDNCDQKMRMLVEIIKTIPKNDRGFVDLSDTDKNIVLQYLT